MHLCVFHHASWHALHHVKQASFITCSAYEGEKIRADQVLEKVHPSVLLVPSLTPMILCETNLLYNAGKPWSINPSLVFTIFITL
jgi:hypothetical protein